MKNKNKNILLSIISVVALLSFTNVGAITIDSQIEDELNEEMQYEIVENAQNLNEKITFTKIDSCKSMESVMSEFLETYKKLHPQRDYTRGVNYDSLKGVDMDISFTNGMAERSSDNSIAESMENIQSSTDMGTILDYSTTNIQKNTEREIFDYIDLKSIEKLLSNISNKTNNTEASNGDDTNEDILEQESIQENYEELIDDEYLDVTEREDIPSNSIESEELDESNLENGELKGEEVGSSDIESET